MRTEDQIAETKKILTDSAKPTPRDDELWLADQANQLRHLVPEYKDEQVFEHERPMLLERLYEMGWTQKEVAGISAKQLQQIRRDYLKELNSDRLDRRVAHVKKTGGSETKQISALLRAVGATRHRSSALR